MKKIIVLLVAVTMLMGCATVKGLFTNNEADLQLAVHIATAIVVKGHPADAAKIETMVWLLSKVANEDLDAIWIALLTELRERGYKLQDEPGALLERLKRRF